MAVLRVLVDADCCPLLVRNYLFSCAKKFCFQLIFVANKMLPCAEKNANFLMVVCEKKIQAADEWILKNVRENDIVLTRDIPLAQVLFEKKICVMNDFGLVFCAKSIERKLKERELDLQMREMGLGTKRRTSYSKTALLKFAKSFEAEIQKFA